MCTGAEGAIISAIISGGAQMGSSLLNRKKGSGIATPSASASPGAPDFFGGGDLLQRAGLPTRGTPPTFPTNAMTAPPARAPYREDPYMSMFKPRVYDEAFAGAY